MRSVCRRWCLIQPDCASLLRGHLPEYPHYMCWSGFAFILPLLSGLYLGFKTKVVCVGLWVSTLLKSEQLYPTAGYCRGLVLIA